jgi:ligand-binding SRPBCC domain-containing protein
VKIVLMTKVDADLEQVKELLNRELLEAMNPPWMKSEIDRFDGLSKGDEFHLRIGIAPLEQKWLGRIVDRRESATEFTYTDVGILLPLPLKKWRHHHRFLRRPEGGTLIRDEIEYSTGRLALDAAIYPVLYGQFAWRQPVYKKFLTRTPS